MKIKHNFETTYLPQKSLYENFIVTFEELVNLCEEAVSFGALGDNISVRKSLDQLRQVWSNLPEDFLSVDFSHNTEDQKKLSELLGRFDKTQPFIQAWNKRFEALLDDEQFQKSDEGLQYLIDSRLPPAWDWNTDLIVLFSRQKNRLRKFLNDRGQKRIFIFSGIASNKRIEAVEAAFWEHCTSGISKRIMLIESPISDRQSKEVIKIVTALYDVRMKAFSTLITNQRNFQDTPLQRIQNSPNLVESLQIEDLESKISGKPVVLVNPGPSLSKNIALLKPYKENVIIVAVAQSVPALLKHDIQPDYVVAIDSCNYSHAIEGLDFEKTSAILLDNVHESFFNKPFRKIYTIFTPETPPQMLKTFEWTPTKLIGGSVSVFSFNLLSLLKASAVALIGQDLATSEGAYYVDYEEPLVNYNTHPGKWLLPGYSGGKVSTRGDYFVYHGELVLSAKTIKDIGQKVQLYNCTEGGAFIGGFVHKPLNSFLKKFAVLPLKKDDARKNLLEIKKSRSKTDLMIEYLEEVRKKGKKAIFLIKEGEQIFSGKKELSLLQKNSVDLQRLILKSDELSCLSIPYILEIDRRVERNKLIKNDHQINRELYSNLKCDAERLVESCDKAILALKCVSIEKLVKC